MQGCWCKIQRPLRFTEAILKMLFGQLIYLLVNLVFFLMKNLTKFTLCTNYLLWYRFSLKGCSAQTYYLLLKQLYCKLVRIHED